MNRRDLAYTVGAIEAIKRMLTQHPARLLFLTPDNQPTLLAEDMGQELYLIGGTELMQQVSNALPEQAAEALSSAWMGIGSWNTAVKKETSA